MRKSTIIAMLVLLACIALGFVFPSCKTHVEPNPYWYSGDGPIASRDEVGDSLFNLFLICSENEGDAGCDSCWSVIVEQKPWGETAKDDFYVRRQGHFIEIE